MAYTPNNICVYLNAAAGCLSALGRAGYSLDIQQSNNTSYAEQADAYAQQFDQLWGTTSPTDFQEAMILVASSHLFASHSPLGEPNGLVPSNYTQMVQSVIARVKQGSAQVDAEGISENCPSAGSSGITLLALSRQAEAVVTSAVLTDVVRLNPNPFSSKAGAKLYVAASVSGGTGTIDLVDFTTGRSLLASQLDFTNVSPAASILSVDLAEPMVVGDEIILQGQVTGGDGPQLTVQSAWIL